MNEQREGAGWYSDPTEMNELRYFGGQWTDQVSTRGVASRQPLPVASLAGWRAGDPDAPHSRKRRTWIIAAAAGVAVAVIAISVAVLSVGAGSSGGGNLASFCRDAPKTIVDVTLADFSVGSDPSADELSTLNVAAQETGVLAKEAPSTLRGGGSGAQLKAELTRIHQFFLAEVNSTHGDTSAAAQLENYGPTADLLDVEMTAGVQCETH
jgi:hypothetical protein